MVSRFESEFRRLEFVLSEPYVPNVLFPASFSPSHQSEHLTISVDQPFLSDTLPDQKAL